MKLIDLLNIYIKNNLPSLNSVCLKTRRRRRKNYDFFKSAIGTERREKNILWIESEICRITRDNLAVKYY